jgi:hypothetical protein
LCEDIVSSIYRLSRQSWYFTDGSTIHSKGLRVA